MLLFRGANPNLKNEDGRTALHHACSLGFENIVEALLDAGAWIEAQDKSGFKAIHFAAHGNHFKVVQLLEKFGADMSSSSYSGKMPLALTTNPDIKDLLQGKRTSFTDPFEADLFNHPLLGKSKLWFSMCPGRCDSKWRRSLPMDIEAMKSLKIKTIVTTLTQDELDASGLKNLSKTFETSGFEAIWFPIPDQWIPTDMDLFIKFVEIIVNKLTDPEQAASILIHCHGRRGRIGLLAVATFIGLGLDVDAAIHLVRSVRSGMLQNPAHVVYVHSFESAWLKKKNPTPPSDLMNSVETFFSNIFS